MTMCSDIQYQASGTYVCTYVHVHSGYAFIDLLCPIANISGRMPITVLAQSTSVNVIISGSGEVYTCTVNNQTVNITSGQPAAQLTGLSPNTKYTVTCYGMNDSCLEARATFTTGTVYV